MNKEWIAHAIIEYATQVTQDEWERRKAVLDVKADETVEGIRERASIAAHRSDSKTPMSVMLYFAQEEGRR